MAYKKYIKRNGKVYGPYLYHSKRVGGKVVSEYKGQGENTFVSRKKLFVLGAILLFIFIAIVFVQNIGFTGRSIVNINTERINDSIVGDLEFVIYGGELIPADSLVLIENAQETYNFTLSEVLGEDTVLGSYYLEGASLNGSGEGYGLIGEKTVPGVVFFDLELFNVTEVESENETITEEVLVDTVSFDLESGENMEYSVEGYSDYEISNIRSETESLSSSVLNVEESDGVLSISADYSLSEEGFGQDFLTDYEKTYSVDFSSLGVDLEPGDLTFSMYFEDEELVSYNTVIEEVDLNETQNVTEEFNETGVNETLENETSEDGLEEEVNETFENVTKELNESEVNETVENQTLENETVSDNVTETIIQESVFDDLVLLPSEKSILESSFDSTIVSSKAVDYRDRVIVTFSIGEFSLSNSYNENLNDTEILKVIKRDRILWLRDLARELEDSDFDVSIREDLNGFYKI